MMLEAFVGCVYDAYDAFTAALRGSRKVQQFLDLLRVQKNQAYATVDRVYLPIILKSCMEVPPIVWWKRVAERMTIHNNDPTVEPNAPRGTFLITTFLFHTAKFPSFFPSALFPAINANWDALVEEAALTHQGLYQFKSKYDAVMANDPNRYRGIYGDDEKALRREEYCSAVAYLMLLGNAAARLQAIQVI
jgi:hypothetical protein